MNNHLFRRALEQVSEADWQSLYEGRCLLIKDDSELMIGISGSPNSLFKHSDFDCSDALDLKVQVLNKSAEILDNYYRSFPLTLVGFNRQVEKLIERFGVEDFSAVLGGVAKRTFFVEGGEVIVESVESPRHSYGVFFEMDLPLSGSELKEAFHHWLASSGAYFEYVGMNVYRYN